MNIFYREKAKGPQSIIKVGDKESLSVTAAKTLWFEGKNTEGGEKMKKKAKLTFKNKVRRRETVRDERSNGRRGSGR